MTKTVDNLDVLLINMPFGLHYVPRLGLSLLKASLIKNGFTSKIKYYNLKFTKLIGERFNSNISLGVPGYRYLLGEWIFAETLFNNLATNEEYIDRVLKGDNGENIAYSRNLEYKTNILDKATEELINAIPEIKSKTEPFLEYCLKDILSIKPKIIGFTSSFQQNIASLSLAKRIKEKLPETIILFGGANCEDWMGIELVRKFLFVDIVVSGEADKILPELVNRIINKKDYTDICGVICQKNIDKFANGIPEHHMIKEMDALPIPDYDEFFEQYEYYNIEKYPGPPVLSFESSRGCWWGEKSHCTFCGLNGNGLIHRSKSSERLLDEIKYLNKRYKINHFAATDNILDMSYFKDFIPALIDENMNLEIFYEVKANLRKEQVIAMKKSGIKIIQPGIETLNSNILSLMKKGIKAIQNVQLLKWSKELGIKVEWNILCGFYGEKPEDYFEMAQLIPKISHLLPPASMHRLRLDRFSPHFNHPEKYTIRNISLVPAYKFIYPFEEESVYNLSFFFDYEYDVAPGIEPAIKKVRDEVFKWKSNFSEVDLFFLERDGVIVIYDLRGISKEHFYILKEKEKFLYILCDKIQTFGNILKEFSVHFGYEPNNEEINNILESFINKDLMIKENNSYLSLALPLSNYKPTKKIINKMAVLLKGQPTGAIR